MGALVAGPGCFPNNLSSYATPPVVDLEGLISVSFARDGLGLAIAYAVASLVVAPCGVVVPAPVVRTAPSRRLQPDDSGDAKIAIEVLHTLRVVRVPAATEVGWDRREMGDALEASRKTSLVVNGNRYRALAVVDQLACWHLRRGCGQGEARK